MAETESLTVRIDKPIKHDLHALARITNRSMSYHTGKALDEYVHRERQRVEQLSQEIQAGIATLDAGKGIRMSRGLFDDVKNRGRARLAKLDEQA